MIKFFAWLFGRKERDHVPFYDAKTRKTVYIPKAELSQTAIFVRIQGFPEPVYVDAVDAKLSEAILQPPFEGEEKLAIESLVTDLADVYPMTYKQWEDGFRTEPRPQKEIAGWVHLAAILKSMSQRHDFDLQSRKDCFQVLVACFNGERSTVRDRSKVKVLSTAHVEQAITYWYEGGYT